jgi:HK97 family phage major capsid protein
MKLKELLEKWSQKDAELKGLLEAAKAADGGYSAATEDQVKAIEAVEAEIKALDTQIAEAKALEEKLAKMESDRADFAAKNVTFITGGRPGGAGQQPGTGGKSNELPTDFKTAFDEKAYNTLLDRKSVDILFDVKTLFSTANGMPLRPRQENRVVTQAERAISLFDYIPTVFNDGDEVSVNYYSELPRTNAADFRNESTQATASPLAESAFEFEILTAKAEFVGHILPVTEEQLMNHRELRRVLDGLMLWGVRDKAQSSALVGNGTAPQIRGFLNFAGIQTHARGTDIIQDAIVKARTKLAVNAERIADFLIMNPADVEKVVLTKDGNMRPVGSEEYAVFSELFNNRLETTAIPAGTALMGARQDLLAEFINSIRLEYGTIGSDFQNMVTRVRAYTRMRTRVFRQPGLIKVTGL